MTVDAVDGNLVLLLTAILEHQVNRKKMFSMNICGGVPAATQIKISSLPRSYQSLIEFTQVISEPDRVYPGHIRA